MGGGLLPSYRRAVKHVDGRPAGVPTDQKAGKVGCPDFLEYAGMLLGVKLSCDQAAPGEAFRYSGSDRTVSCSKRSQISFCEVQIACGQIFEI